MEFEELRAYRESLNQKRTYQPPDILLQLSSDSSILPCSRVQYTKMYKNWEEFKLCIQDPMNRADFDTLCTFFFWLAQKSRGKLSQHSTVSTLEFQVERLVFLLVKYYNITMPYNTVKKLQKFVRVELAATLGLSDKEYQKGICDWEDIKIMIRFLITNDKHIYGDERQRLQTIWLLLLISDGGERIGAIVRSDCYRASEDALSYKDVRLYLRPTSSPDASPQFKLVITYRNRKGFRNKPKQFFQQPYIQRSNIIHCIVGWFLVLALLDNAFEGISTPLDLLNIRNPTCADVQICFKDSIMDIPILRRFSQKEGRCSPNLPLSSTSATTDAQRVARQVGFKDRFTYYSVRRGVANKISDHSSVSDTRRKQLMGHSGRSDKVFKKSYESRMFTVDTGNIFRGEEPSTDKAEELSMHLKRDPAAPVDLPEGSWEEIYDEDQTIRDLVDSRVELKQQLETCTDSEWGYEQVTIKAALVANQRALNNRRRKVRQYERTKHRDEYFTTRSSKLLQGELVGYEEATFRAHLEAVLYGSNTPTIVALTALIANCTDESGILRNGPRRRVRDPGVDFDYADDQLLKGLKEDTTLTLTWTQIAVYFPGRSADSLALRYKEIKSTGTQYKVTSKRKHALDDELLLCLKQDLSLPWKSILKYFPNRNQGCLANRYQKLMSEERASGLEENCPAKKRRKVLPNNKGQD